MTSSFTRRPFQFSLLTLFVVVTIVAVLSTVVAWVVKDRQQLVRERDEARQELTMERERKEDAIIQTMKAEEGAILTEKAMKELKRKYGEGK